MPVVGTRSATSRPSHAIRLPGAASGASGNSGCTGESKSSIVTSRPPRRLRCVTARTIRANGTGNSPKGDFCSHSRDCFAGLVCYDALGRQQYASAGPFVVCLVTAASTCTNTAAGESEVHNGDLAPATLSASRMARQIRRLGFATTSGSRVMGLNESPPLWSLPPCSRWAATAPISRQAASPVVTAVPARQVSLRLEPPLLSGGRRQHRHATGLQLGHDGTAYLYERCGIGSVQSDLSNGL